MAESYVNFTPTMARELSQKHTNWQEVCQRHIDIVVPEACKLGKRKAVINLTEFIEDASKDDLDRIRCALENMGWDVEGFEQLNVKNISVRIAW